MEQNLIIFLFSAVIISLSGVLSPGPLTAAVIEQGGRNKLSGVYFSLGHGVVELPLILLISLGAGSFFELEQVRIVVGIAGGIYLLFMGKGLLRPGENKKDYERRIPSSFYSGAFLSIGNPYFLLWWATIGLGLVISATDFGITGLVLFAAVHWLCDLIWLSFLSMASHKGIKTFGAGLYKKISIFCGIVMLFYGSVFIVDSVKLLIK
jgi:threonine/homoserine/homoserine lactone efflux protein